MAALVVKRNRGAIGLAVPYRITVDDRRIGRVWAGGHLTVGLDPGAHVVQLRSGGQVIAQSVIHLGDDTTFVEAAAQISLGNLLRSLLGRPRVDLNETPAAGSIAPHCSIDC